MVVELIYNLSVLVAISILSNFVDARYSRKETAGKVLQGILFGATSIIGMSNPLVLTEGLIFDGRTIVLSLCTLFFGPISGGIAAGMAGIYRISIGGIGLTMGLSTIISATIIGYLFYYHRVSNGYYKMTKARLYVMGLIVHFTMLLLILTVPFNRIAETYELLTATILGIYPFASLLIGKILLEQEENTQLIKEIKRGTERYRGLFNSIRDAILVSDLERKITDCNPAFTDFLGYKKEELIGRDTRFVFAHEKDYKRIGDILISESEKKSSNIELKYKNKQGKTVTGEVNFFIFRESDGRKAGYVASIRDITDRKLLEYEKYGLIEIIENSLNEIYVFDPDDLRFLYVNQRGISNTGYTSDELMNITPLVLKPFISETKFNTIILPLKMGLKEKAIFETIHRRKDGTEYPVEVHLQYSTYRNSAAYIAIINDITEKKIQEAAITEGSEHLDLLFENSMDVILLTHPSGKVLKANDAAERVFGYSKEEILSIGRGAIVDVNDPRLEKALEIRKQTGSFKGELTGRKKDGTFFPIEIATSLFKDKNGEVLSSMIVRDISEQKKYEETIKEKINELEKFNKFMMGREVKMLELKKEINELCKMLGMDERYKIE